MLKPKLFTTLKGYTKEQLIGDITAGIIVGIIAIPLSIALAIASGVSPEKGLHTAIIAGFFISLLGGSRVQIGGPTGAFVVILYGIMAKYGLDGLIISTIMAGLMLIAMGLLRFGSVIKFIPYPITTGFTSGIAFVIFSSQIKDFLGLKIENVPSEIIEKYSSYFEHISTASVQTMIVGIISLLIIIYWPKINKKIPGSLVAIIIATAVTLIFKLDVETIGSRFGEISGSFPRPSLPALTLERIRELFMPAMTIAILAAIESLLSAVVADGMIGGKHRSNMELVAQGVANTMSGLFGGIPATGAIARTAANIKNGGRTPIAGITHSITVLIVMLVLMPYAKYIPMTTLAAILIIVAYNMSEWRSFKGLLKAPKSDIAILLVTFFLTVLIDLVVAIEVGMILAMMLFMKRMADVTNVKDLSMELEDSIEEEHLREKLSTSDVQIYEINGPFFFGAANKFIESMETLSQMPKVLIIGMQKVPALDATGFHALKGLFKECIHSGTYLILSGVQQQPRTMLDKYGFSQKIGVESFTATIEESIIKANEITTKGFENGKRK